MSWSYTGDPSTSDKDLTRFLIGDTDADNQLVSNEEINYVLTSEGSAAGAAIKLCYTLAAKFSSKIDQKVGAIDYKCSQYAKHYLDLAKQLEKKRNLDGIAPYAGGLSKSDKEEQALDTDRVSPKFTKELHENKSTDTDTNELYGC